MFQTWRETETQSLDTGVYFSQRPELAAFARAVPNLPIIRCSKGYSAAERAAFFHGTTVRAYRSAG